MENIETFRQVISSSINFKLLKGLSNKYVVGQPVPLLICGTEYQLLLFITSKYHYYTTKNI